MTGSVPAQVLSASNDIWRPRGRGTRHNREGLIVRAHPPRDLCLLPADSSSRNIKHTQPTTSTQGASCSALLRSQPREIAATHHHHHHHRSPLPSCRSLKHRRPPSGPPSPRRRNTRLLLRCSSNLLSTKPNSSRCEHRPIPRPRSPSRRWPRALELQHRQAHPHQRPACLLHLCLLRARATLLRILSRCRTAEARPLRLPTTDPAFRRLTRLIKRTIRHLSTPTSPTQLIRPTPSIPSRRPPLRVP